MRALENIRENYADNKKVVQKFDTENNLTILIT